MQTAGLNNKVATVSFYSAANKGRSTVNYRQSSAFDRPYLSCNDHCDRWLLLEIFFINFIFIS